MADLLTDDDLDDLAQSAREGADPASVIAALLAVVTEQRLADPADETYAFGLAAEIAERGGDLNRAVEYARLAASSARGEDYHHASHARLLLLAGRDAEGLALLDSLRPYLVDDYMVAESVLEALQESGRLEQALEWSSAALEQAFPRWVELSKNPDDREYRQAAMVTFELASRRRDLREELGLPLDEYDGRVETLQSAAVALGEDDDFDESDAVLALFWPQRDFDQLMGAAPELSTVFGATWDEHRAKVEGAMAMLSATGVPSLALMEGSFDRLVGFAAARGGPITDDQVRDEYAGTIDELQSWPPPKGLPCWCGSGLKYRECCLPRSVVAHV
jgi:hypothetical protein